MVVFKIADGKEAGHGCDIDVKLLSGMGSDGADGIRHIKARGGITVAHNMATSIIHSMPKAAFETGMVDFVLSPEGIRAKLLELTLAPVPPHPQT